MEASSRVFAIGPCLGRGGFGEVYRARMERDGAVTAEVALKVLRRDIDADGQAVERLRDEGRLLSQLNHPAILRVHDLVVLEGRISLVTEFVDGDDLTVCMQPPERIGARALLQVVARIASALDAAWTSQPPGWNEPLRMVHRDIKPSNIRLSRHGDVKLLDFGIARTDGMDREARTRTDMMVGSPAYMAPERFMEKDILLHSDVFSLGAVLYEGLTGHRFYRDLPVPMQVGLAVHDTRFAEWLEKRLAELDVASALTQLVEHALAYDPSQRPSPAELALACDRLADEMSGATLSRFCRHRVWSDGARIQGELDGRTVTEGTLARPRSLDRVHTLPETMPSSRPREDLPEVGAGLSWMRLAIGAVAVVFGLAGVSALLGVAAIFLVPLWVEPTITDPGSIGRLPAPAVLPKPEPEPEPEPPPAPRSSPAPEPAPMPVAPRAAPVAPAPVVPVPVEVPSPPPEPSGPEPGRVVLEGGVVALAVGPSGTHVLPASLAPGTYRLTAKFNGRDAVDAGTLSIRSGETIWVSCSVRMTRCSQRR